MSGKRDKSDAPRLPYTGLRWVVVVYASAVLLVGLFDLLYFSGTSATLRSVLLLLLGVVAWGGFLVLRRVGEAWIVYHLGAALLLESVLYWFYAGSFHALVWQILIIGCFFSLCVEQARAWLRWRWLREISQKGGWDTRPIEGDDAEGLPMVFDWQTKLGSGVLSYKLRGQDAYRGGLQRIPVAVAPFDLQYARAILSFRTFVLFALLIAPLLAYSSWHSRSYFDVSERPTDLALGDVDQDGDLDLVTSHLSPSFLSVLLNDGTGRFGPYAEVRGASARSVGLADVDQNGVLIAITQDLSSQDEARVYPLVDEVGVFSPGTITVLDYAYPPPSQAIDRPVREFGNQSWQAFGDLDRDGEQDTAIVMTTHGLLVYPLNYDPNVEPAELPHPSRSGYRLSSVALHDLGEDGDLDIIAVAPELGVVFAYLNEEQRFSPPMELLQIEDLASVSFGHLNEDDALDLVANAQHNQSVQIFLGDGNGGFAFFEKVGDQKQGVRATNPKVALGDLDGDQDLDIVTTDFYNDQVRVLFNDGKARFSLR